MSKVYLGSCVYSCTHWLRSRNSPPATAFGFINEVAVGQPRKTAFLCNPMGSTVRGREQRTKDLVVLKKSATSKYMALCEYGSCMEGGGGLCWGVCVIVYVGEVRGTVLE